jgi:hypothetical protein
MKARRIKKFGTEIDNRLKRDVPWGTSRHGAHGDIKDFKATQVTYNRNGISGRPFYSVVFSYVDCSYADEPLKPNMLAIVPDEGSEEECFVVDMNDPSQCWRGVDFLAAVTAAIKEADWASWKPTADR